jgi:hypothetical protein
MKKYGLLTFFLVIFCSESFSQLWKLRRLELSGGVGTTHFMGDVGGFTEGNNNGGFRDISFQNTGWNAGLSVGYRITSGFSARADFTGGYFSADDVRGSNTDRGFSATMPFFEASLSGQVYFIKNRMEERYLFIRGKRTSLIPEFHHYDLYAFAGIGALSYQVKPNPTLDAAPQRTALSGIMPVAPIGIGISRNFPRNSKLGLELGRRFTQSDELDGYSAAGSRLDVYYFFDITYTWKIRTKRFPSF